MEQRINWVEPELKWVDFEAGEYVAACQKTVDITSCAICNMGSGGHYYVDVDGDGLSVADVNNNMGYHREYSRPCVSTNPFTATESFFSVFLGGQLQNEFEALANGFSGDTILYQNGSWAEGAVRDWVEKNNYWTSQFKEGYTYSSDASAYSPFTETDMASGLSNNS